MKFRSFVAFALLLAFAMPALAQHEHGAPATRIVIAHDSPASGRQYVGGLAHFGVLDLGDDIVPDFHQQNHIRVIENGAVLMETTPDSGHDYDGVNMFDVSFPVAGNYTVEALGESGNVTASFSGFVVDALAAPNHASGLIVVDGAPQQQTFPGALTTFTYNFVDNADGKTPLAHTDAWFEVREGNDLVFRTKTHTHEGAQQVSYAFPGLGTYTVRITGYVAFASANATLVSPYTWQQDVTVAPGPQQDLPAPPAVPPRVPIVPDAPLSNGIVMGVDSSAEITAIGTYDPWTTVGTQTQQHLTVLAMDPATHHPVQHVDFKATLTDGLGRVLFKSDTLHEYDGIYEFTAREPVGQYVLTVYASRDTWSSHVEMPYTVVPPFMASSIAVPPAPLVGPVSYDVGGLDGIVDGHAFNLTLVSHTALGQPFPHSEVDYQIVAERASTNGYLALAGKLHTHDDGKFQLTTALPAGNYTLRLSPFALEQQPVLAQAVAIGFNVAQGPGFPLAKAADAADNALDLNAQVVAGPSLALAALGVVGAALVVARRRD